MGKRKINLDGADNIRDLGGLTNHEGQTLRMQQFLRSNVLANLSSRDVETLLKYGLRQVIDLRTKTETEERPNVRIDGVRYHHIPLIDEQAIGITRDAESEAAFEKLVAEGGDGFMPYMYRRIVSDPSAILQLRRVFDIILNDSDGITLWHCQAGKDRCGIVSALFLTLLDVDPATIMDDYLMTNDAAMSWARARYDEVLAETGDETLADLQSKHFLADRSYLVAARDAITEQFGSVQDFIRNELGITKEMQEKLKQRMLEA